MNREPTFRTLDCLRASPRSRSFRNIGYWRLWRWASSYLKQVPPAFPSAGSLDAQPKRWRELVGARLPFRL